MDWYDKERIQLDKELEAGEITPAQHREAIKDLEESLREEAEDAVRDWYGDVER